MENGEVEKALREVQRLSKEMAEKGAELLEKEEAYRKKDGYYKGQDEYYKNLEKEIDDVKKYRQNRMKEIEKFEGLLREKDEKYEGIKGKYTALEAKCNDDENHIKDLEQRITSLKEGYEKSKANPEIPNDIYKKSELDELKERLKRYENAAAIQSRAGKKLKYAALALGAGFLISLGYIGFNYSKKDEPKILEEAVSYNSNAAESSYTPTATVNENYSAEKSTPIESIKIRSDEDIAKEIEALKALPKTDSRAMEISKLRAEREKLKKSAKKR